MLLALAPAVVLVWVTRHSLWPFLIVSAWSAAYYLVLCLRRTVATVRQLRLPDDREVQ
ncbi:MAG: hypothetical protein QOJ50_1670 [Cryptosporangiaceae bacterium]|nr:hypothetical protein [Cryptosporangiaceae bacterium]